MSSFTTPLELEYIDGREWRLTAPFSYRTDPPDCHNITVPSGFVTDFASIPRALWVTMPPTGPYGKAAVIHDWLYRNGGKIPWAQAEDGSWTYRIYTRAQVDKIFFEAMGVLGVSGYRRTIMYLGVRAGGWASFKAQGNF